MTRLARADEKISAVRRGVVLLLGVALGAVLLAYATLSGFARRPLNGSEFWTFAAAVLRATPAHLRSSNPIETLRLGGVAFGSPARAVTLPSTIGST